ncbi:MAG TPA: FAD-dependent monooxygenase [Verrucomicrobiae bacterium]|nr:FAD-dependent monooxygenase [Verrucomicrobiae bacterium]
MRNGQTEVLVVGAGPVGLWTTLLLSRAGLEPTLIDREERTAARSYACALHPRSLEMLQREGLLEPALALGRKVTTMAFYEGTERRGALDLSRNGSQFGYLLILPQNALEGLLEQRLKQAGVKVQWRHRLDDLVDEEEAVTATVEELQGTASGYIVPHWEMVVKSRTAVRAQFLVGADGHASLVRQRLHFDLQRLGPTTNFAAYEFETADHCADEVRVVLDGQTTNVLWPLPNNRYRWTFQLLHGEAEFPEKERRAVRLDQPEVDERLKQYVEKVARQRAPWFEAKVSRITWCSRVAFEQSLAGAFGRHRCWLAGDAAHQTGPVGVQSMNAGFAEADGLCALMAKVLKQEAEFSALNEYNQLWQKEWQRLLGGQLRVQPQAKTNPWFGQKVSELRSCLPGLGTELGGLAAQLGLEFPVT